MKWFVRIVAPVPKPLIFPVSMWLLQNFCTLRNYCLMPIHGLANTRVGAARLHPSATHLLIFSDQDFYLRLIHSFYSHAWSSGILARLDSDDEITNTSQPTPVLRSQLLCLHFVDLFGPSFKQILMFSLKKSLSAFKFSFSIIPLQFIHVV